MKITIYDGANTIGGNKIHIREGNRGLFLDFGLNFSKYGKYYEEYVSERVARGIYDLWSLNLIPRLNIYRGDIIPWDLNTSNYPKIPVDAVLLSHGHLDHAGNISLLNHNIPIVLSPPTAVILKALNDTTTSLGTEIPYYREKEHKDEYTVVAKRYGYKTRKLIITERRDVGDIIYFHPGKERVEQGDMEFLGDTSLGFEIESYPVDHSIFGSAGFIIGGDVEIAYTGDFRLHGKRGMKTEEFIRRAKSARVLITEGTRVGENRENISEDAVYRNSLEVVEDSTGIVIADFSPRNFERMETFHKIARKTGREIVVTMKDAYFIHFLKEIGEMEDFTHFLIYDSIRVRRERWERFTRENYGEVLISPPEIKKSVERYILCFSFYDMPHLLDIDPRDGTYIYSSSEAFNEESIYSFERLWNWLRHFNFRVHGFGFEKGKLHFESGFHASGHISQGELERVIEGIDPDYIVPVHTEKPEWFSHNFEGTTIIGNNESREF